MGLVEVNNVTFIVKEAKVGKNTIKALGIPT